mgnify:FL=1|jgi:hypothetical protein|tara:strand:- start:945 stop:1307 length:363 start_codon:yes stop_codon:yes gene_type:complete
MTKQKNTLKKIRVKKASQQQKLALLNYGILKTTISEYTKQTSLMKPEYVQTFKDLKTNLIILNDMGNDFEGFAQLIQRKMKRFDTTKFKEKFPKLYEEFLVEQETTEIKVKYEKIGGADA